MHRSGALLGTADALSRLPLQSPDETTPIPAEWSTLVNFLDAAPVNSSQVKSSTRTDRTLSKVYRFCAYGWPTVALADPDLAPYFRRRTELSIQDDCVLWGSRVVIPNDLRSSLLDELHSGHAGSSKMKELARSYLWWPNLDRELEELTKSCPECLTSRVAPTKAVLHPWEWPTRPWHRIHIDYTGPVHGRYFFVVVDAHSKWVEIFPTSSTSSRENISCLRHCFAVFGLPVTIVSDNATSFTSAEFQSFVTATGVKHITSAPYHPSTNGLAERMVQTFKKQLRQSREPLRLTLDRFLFNYRLTPHSVPGVAPSELMFGRRLRCRLDLLWPYESVASRVIQRQQSQVASHRGSHSMLFPSSGNVMVRDYSTSASNWSPAVVSRQTSPVSYECKLQGEGLYVVIKTKLLMAPQPQNWVQLRKVPLKQLSRALKNPRDHLPLWFRARALLLQQLLRLYHLPLFLLYAGLHELVNLCLD